MKEIKICSFEGESFNKNENRAWSFIKDVYFDVLKQDKQWHFFYEDYYTVFRFSNEFKNEFVEYLSQRKVVYSEPIEWIDSSKIVEKYKEEYTQLFHIFSMFAIFVPVEEANQVFDRIAHPYWNHSWYKMKDFRNSINTHRLNSHWEEILIAKNAINRAYYNGYYDHIHSMKETPTK